MKILIASDIHGSAEYSSKLFESYKREMPDKLLLLGDILYHGPRNSLPDDYDTKKTMEILNSLKSKIIAVRGNCDAEVDQMVLNFPIMNSYEIIEADGIKIFASHGHHYDPHNLPPFVEFDVIATGHTHIPVLAKYDGFYHVNPGSVSIPKGGSEHSYMIFEEGEFILRRLNDGKMLDKMQVKPLKNDMQLK